MKKQTVEIVVSGLIRDGATSWIADIRIPEFGAEWKGVYLNGATEQEAYQDAVNRVSVRVRVPLDDESSK